MTKKHYEAIAARIKQQVTLRCRVYNDQEVWSSDYSNLETAKALQATASFLADDFQKDNAKFDKERFMNACGFSSKAVHELYQTNPFTQL